MQQQGKKSWANIARELNRKLHNGLPLRRSKQCRERFYNHLDSGVNKGKWATQEDLMIIRQQRALGNKWKDIASLLEGRTENQVKNRFKSLKLKAAKLHLGREDSLELYILNVEAKTTEESLSEFLPSFLERIATKWMEDSDELEEFILPI